MIVMRYTVIDREGTVSFIAPWNTLKALVAGCSRKPAPESLSALLEAATRYDQGLKEYVLNGLAVFDEHHTQAGQNQAETPLNPGLEKDLLEIMGAGHNALPEKTEPPEYDEFPVVEEPPAEITYEELLQHQQRLRGADLARHPVLRVIDDKTRQESLEPVRSGLVIFNLPAKRIIQVQNSYVHLKRSDRGRYFEGGQPTERLYFYRLPSDWSLLP